MSGDFGLPEPRTDGRSGGPGDPPAPTGHPPPPGGLRWSRVLFVAFVLVVLLGAGGVAASVVRDRSGGPSVAGSAATLGATTAAAPTSPTSAAATSAPGPPRSVTSPPGPVVTPTPPPVAPVVPGWQAVAGRELVAYDVPPTWQVEKGDTLTGFEYHDDTDARLVTMHNLASYRSGACPAMPGSARARAGFVSPRGGSATAAAPELSQRWAEVATLQLGGRVSDVSPTQTVTTTVDGAAVGSGSPGSGVAGGAVVATESTTLVRFSSLPRLPACQAPAMTVTAVSFEAHGAVVAFVLWTDEQVADGVTADDANRILRSLRAIG